MSKFLKEDGTRQQRFVYAAGVLVFLTALVHIAVGLVELYGAFVGEGGFALGVLYLLGAVLAFGLIGTYATGKLRSAASFAVGSVLMFGFVFAYADWHVFGFAETYLPIDAVGLEHDHSHDGHDHNGHDHNGHEHDGHSDESALQSFVDHVRNDVFALTSKSAELIAGVLLGVLAVLHR